MHAVKRPGIISTICALGFGATLISFMWVFSPAIKNLGDWYPALFGIINAGAFISYIGIWYMKQWGVQLYILTFFARLSVNIVIEDIGFSTIIVGLISIATIAILIFFYKRMDSNL